MCNITKLVILAITNNPSVGPYEIHFLKKRVVKRGCFLKLMYTTKKGTNELKFIAVTDIYSVSSLFRANTA